MDVKFLDDELTSIIELFNEKSPQRKSLYVPSKERIIRKKINTKKLVDNTIKHINELMLRFMNSKNILSDEKEKIIQQCKSLIKTLSDLNKF